MNVETISACVSQRLLVELACRQCPHVATIDARELLERFRAQRWADSFDEVRRRHRCSKCEGKRLAVRGVRPPRAEVASDSERFVFVLNNRVAAPPRPTIADAIEDAIDAGECEYVGGKPFFKAFARVVNLGV